MENSSSHIFFITIQLIKNLFLMQLVSDGYKEKGSQLSCFAPYLFIQPVRNKEGARLI